MSRRHKTNILLLVIVILAIIVVYNIFSADTAVAPEASTNFTKAEAQATEVVAEQEQQINSEVSADVLMYHHVGPLPSGADDIRKGLTVSTEEFDTQVKYLVDRKYKFLTLSELHQAIEKKKVPEKVAVLTFDDGYDDNYSQAFSVMKKYNVHGTFFLIVNKLGTSEYMTKDQAIELHKAGNEIGSHSMSHPSLEKLKGSALDKEIKTSKEELEKIISDKVVSFCYPAGKFNDDTIKAVGDAGYKMAVTTQSSTGVLLLDHLLEIARYRISSSMNFESRFR